MEILGRKKSKLSNFDICLYLVKIFIFLKNNGFTPLIYQKLEMRANLKTGVSRKQSTQDFPKNEHFLPPDTHTYVTDKHDSNGQTCINSFTTEVIKTSII